MYCTSNIPSVTADCLLTICTVRLTNRQSEQTADSQYPNRYCPSAAAARLADGDLATLKSAVLYDRQICNKSAPDWQMKLSIWNHKSCTILIIIVTVINVKKVNLFLSTPLKTEGREAEV